MIFEYTATTSPYYSSEPYIDENEAIDQLSSIIADDGFIETNKRYPT